MLVPASGKYRGKLRRTMMSSRWSAAQQGRPPWPRGAWDAEVDIRSSGPESASTAELRHESQPRAASLVCVDEGRRRKGLARISTRGSRLSRRGRAKVDGVPEKRPPC